VKKNSLLMIMAFLVIGSISSTAHCAWLCMCPAALPVAEMPAPALTATDANRDVRIFRDAIECGDYKKVATLLDSGFNVNTPLDINGTTPLMLAVQHSIDSGSLRTDIIYALLRKCYAFVPPLSFLALRPNAQHKATGDTPLIMAVRMRQPTVIKLLLDARQDARICNTAGQTALGMAIALRYDDCVAVLTANIDQMEATDEERKLFAREDACNGVHPRCM
jgi:ankyrin repeat protein